MQISCFEQLIKGQFQKNHFCDVMSQALYWNVFVIRNVSFLFGGWGEGVSAVVCLFSGGRGKVCYLLAFWVLFTSLEHGRFGRLIIQGVR